MSTQYDPFPPSSGNDEEGSFDERSSDYEDGSSDDDSDYDEIEIEEKIDKKTKHFLKEHGLAILVAIISTFVSYFKITPRENNMFLSNDVEYFGDAFSSIIPSKRSMKTSSSISEKRKVLPHHVSYRRTAELNFCLEDENAQQFDVERKNLVKNLHRFQFNFAKDLGYAMIHHFENDDIEEKNLLQKHPELKLRRNESLVSEYDLNIACIESSDRAYTYGYSTYYKQPKVSEFYKLAPPERHINYKEKEMKPTPPSYTGFAAKFYNLSPQSLDLWWDGGRGDHLKERKIATVGPFEAVGTATHNAQSFRFSPHYDKSHAIYRMLVTSDDAIQVYDPIKEYQKNGEGKPVILTEEEQKLYDLQLINLAYANDYLVHSGRQWLSMFPRPKPMHFMHSSDYFGQKHKIVTSQTHFTSLPPASKLNRLAMDDYGSLPAVSLKEYRNTEDETLTLTLKAVSCAPRVFEINNFLSSAEVDHILELSANLSFETSTTASTPSSSTSTLRGDQDRKTRSSTNAWVYRENSLVIDSIYRRAADVLNIDESLLRHRDDHEHTELATDHSIAEAIQLVHYGEGEEYTPHHDPVYPSMANRYQPSRFATLLIYLNDTEEGGETIFPRAVNVGSHDGIEITPKKGKAILFYNILEDGNVDDLSQHGGRKVEKGEKWLANLWVWDPIID